jgi:hypothetical protein
MTDMVLTAIIIGAIVVMCHHPTLLTRWIANAVAVGLLLVMQYLDHKPLWIMVAAIVGSALFSTGWIFCRAFYRAWKADNYGKESTDEKTL